jgi:hypothetical protein
MPISVTDVIYQGGGIIITFSDDSVATAVPIVNDQGNLAYSGLTTEQLAAWVRFGQNNVDPSYTVVQGATGAQGPAGSDGSTGPAGATGPTGSGGGGGSPVIVTWDGLNPGVIGQPVRIVGSTATDIVDIVSPRGFGDGVLLNAPALGQPAQVHLCAYGGIVTGHTTPITGSAVAGSWVKLNIPSPKFFTIADDPSNVIWGKALETVGADADFLMVIRSPILGSAIAVPAP